MKRFVRDCLDQILRSVFWAFVIALVIARCFLSDKDALSVSGTIVWHTSWVFALASIALISFRRLLRR